MNERSTPSQELSQTLASQHMSLYMHPSAGYCPVQNRVDNSQQMDAYMNWYVLASRQVSVLAI